MRFRLDTNAVIELLRRSDGPTPRRVRSHAPGDIGHSAIALHELYYGAFKSSHQEKNVTLIDGLRFEVVEFETLDAARESHHYARFETGVIVDTDTCPGARHGARGPDQIVLDGRMAGSAAANGLSFRGSGGSYPLAR